MFDSNVLYTVLGLSCLTLLLGCQGWLWCKMYHTCGMIKDWIKENA